MPFSDRGPRRLAAPVALFVGIILLTAGCGDSPGKADSATTADPTPPADPPPFPPVDAADLDDGQIANPAIPQEPSPFRFAEVATESGIDFVHFSGMEEHRHYPTANGSGVAIFDADGDGRMDLYFATCTRLPLGTEEHGPNRLYLNIGDGTFRDATEESGLGFRGFCHGIVAADFDNDGDQDVFLACYGPNRLYRNDGDGTFTDVSAEAGVENMARTVADAGVQIPGATDAERARLVINWASGGAPIDYDNDGDLDLYVANHGDWRLPEDDQYCGFRRSGHPPLLQPDPGPDRQGRPAPQRRRPDVHRRHRRGRPRPVRRPRLRRRRGRPQRRRPDRPLRRQRPEPQLPLPEQGRRHLRRRHRDLRRRLRHRRPGPVRHGGRRRGRRRRRPARPLRHQLPERVQHPLQQPGRRLLHRHHHLLRPGPGQPPLGRLGLRPGRLRQRRLARLLRRQRPHRRQPPRLRLRRAAAAAPQRRRSATTPPPAASSWPPATSAPTSTLPTSAAAPPSATSTTTATSTSSSTTRTAPPPSSATTPPSTATTGSAWSCTGTRSNRDAVGAVVTVEARRPDPRPPAEGRHQHALVQRPPPADRRRPGRPRRNASPSAGPRAPRRSWRTSRSTGPSNLTEPGEES